MSLILVSLKQTNALTILLPYWSASRQQADESYIYMKCMTLLYYWLNSKGQRKKKSRLLQDAVKTILNWLSEMFLYKMSVEME